MSWGILAEMADPRRRHKTTYEIVGRFEKGKVIPLPQAERRIVAHRPQDIMVAYLVHDVWARPEPEWMATRNDAASCPLCWPRRSSNARG